MTRKAPTPKRSRGRTPAAGLFAGESPDVGEPKAIADEGCNRPIEPYPAAPDSDPREMDTDELLPFGPSRLESEESDDLGIPHARPEGKEALSRHFPSAGGRIRSRLNEGRIVHVPTMIPTLDANTRGGLIAGRLTIIGGAPDAGKTSLAVQIAYDRAREGYAVAIHCADEDAEGIQFRVGQQIGLSLEDLEDGAEMALRRLAEHFDSMPAFLIVDQDEDAAAIEDTGAALVRAASANGAKGFVLVVDSIQTARAKAAEDAPSIRERTTATTSELRRFAKTTGALVIATCELSRAAYRSRSAKDRVEDMAAFKESGAVEYHMNTGLVLRPVPGSEDEIDVSIPKNKRGRRTAFRLRRDPLRCAYVEVPMPADADEQGERRTALEAKILAYARENPGAGVTAVRAAVGGNATLAKLAIDALVARGVLRSEPAPRGVRLFVASAGDKPP